MSSSFKKISSWNTKNKEGITIGLTTESKRGSDCSLTDGVINRVLTLANTQMTLSGGFTVYVNGLSRVPTTEYTVSHKVAASTITFLNAVWDADYIVVIYVQGSGAPSVSRYCTYQDVYTKTGLSATELSSTIVDFLIIDGEAEIDMLCGRAFTNANSATEFLSTKRADILDKETTSFSVSRWPIQSVTECKLLDIDGNAIATFDTLSSAEIVAGTYQSDDYWLDVINDPITNTTTPIGHFKLKTDSIAEGTNNVKVTYTYGYSAVPDVIRMLSQCMAGIRCWLTFMGGQYNRIDSYNIPQQAVNKGAFYDRCMKNVQILTEEANRLLDRIGRKPRRLFFASGNAR